MEGSKLIEKQLVLRSLGPQVCSFEVFYGSIEDGQFVPELGFMKPDSDFWNYFGVEKSVSLDFLFESILFTSDAIGAGVYLKRSDFYRFIVSATSLFSIDSVQWMGDVIVFKYTFHVPKENKKDENA